jgi:hypothetical protein
VALHGQQLGAELGEIYRMGKETLPTLAADYVTAWQQTPESVSSLTRRGNGLGEDPARVLNDLLDLVNDAVRTTQHALQDVAERLVWTAEDYKATDQEAQAEFERHKKEVDG